MQSFYLFGAGATGFEPAILALTGPHVRPLHHAPERKWVYHTPYGSSSNKLLWLIILLNGVRFRGPSYARPYY